MNNDISVIILTYNEEIHIDRTLRNVKKLTSNIFIIDSYSHDRTIEICQFHNATVVQNKFIDHASQLNWALSNITINTDWVIRLDADEYFMDELIDEINSKVKLLDNDVSGIYFKRRVYFLGKWIKYGGYYPTTLLRMWRNGSGSFEQRSMDEHFVLHNGRTLVFDFDIVDENLNNVTWWISKHNSYATKEALDILLVDKEHRKIADKLTLGKTETSTRWYKNNFYLKLPLFFRSLLYFLFRYIFKFGFLDGTRGFLWHILQGFWYRLLVDTKIFDIKRRSRMKNVSIKEILTNDYNVRIK